MYDFLIVGAGLFGSVFACEAKKKGHKCLVIDKRSHIGGNCYTEKKDGIHIHTYGPHIFHTSKKSIWNYINKVVPFNHFEYKPKVNYEGTIYSFPINMMTFHQLWGCVTPGETKEKLEKCKHKIAKPKNLEEWFLSQVGTEIYEKFFKNYTQKQWGTSPSNLPCFIGKRIPIRFEYNENYYNDKYQGIPDGGYTRIFETLLDGIDVSTNIDFLYDRDIANKAKKIIFTGCIDEYFDYQFGKLDYRSLRFITTKFSRKDHLGNVAFNYTGLDTKRTREIEHKHFQWIDNNTTYVTSEIPVPHKEGRVPFYPVNTERNNNRYKKYLKLASKYNNIYFGGRTGTFQYLNMDQTIEQALKLAKELL